MAVRLKYIMANELDIDPDASDEESGALILQSIAANAEYARQTIKPTYVWK